MTLLIKPIVTNLFRQPEVKGGRAKDSSGRIHGNHLRPFFRGILSMLLNVHILSFSWLYCEVVGLTNNLIPQGINSTPQLPIVPLYFESNNFPRIDKFVNNSTKFL